MNRRVKHPCGATHSPHLTARLFSCYAQAETRTLCTPMTTSPVNKLARPNLVPSRDLPTFISSEKTNPSRLVRSVGEKPDFCSNLRRIHGFTSNAEANRASVSAPPSAPGLSCRVSRRLQTGSYTHRCGENRRKLISACLEFQPRQKQQSRIITVKKRSQSCCRVLAVFDVLISTRILAGRPFIVVKMTT